MIRLYLNGGGQDKRSLMILEILFPGAHSPRSWACQIGALQSLDINNPGANEWPISQKLLIHANLMAPERFPLNFWALSIHHRRPWGRHFFMLNLLGIATEIRWAIHTENRDRMAAISKNYGGLNRLCNYLIKKGALSHSEKREALHFNGHRYRGRRFWSFATWGLTRGQGPLIIKE